MRPVDSVICWRWTPARGYRSTYAPETVNTLRRMVARHYPYPHRFICVTDSPKGIDPDITVLPDFDDFTSLPSPHGGKNPSCYRRLRLFHPDAAQWFGDRYVSLDLDVVITGDLTPLWHRDEDIVLWGNTNPTTTYNGSMVLLTAGTRSQVWDRFDPTRTPRDARAAGQYGSDQATISYLLGPHEAKWTKADGVFSYRNDIRPNANRLPDHARVIVFHGQYDPWQADVQARCPWVREYYRMTEAVTA